MEERWAWGATTERYLNTPVLQNFTNNGTTGVFGARLQQWQTVTRYPYCPNLVVAEARWCSKKIDEILAWEKQQGNGPDPW
jgi:hypothetical protein